MWLKAAGALICALIVAAILYPMLAQTKGGGPNLCLSNVKQLALASLLYQNDHDRFPLAGNWVEETSPYTHKEDIYTCPAVKRDLHRSFGYAYNSLLSGAAEIKDAARASETLMIYDSANLVRDTSDPGTSLPREGRHHGRNNVAFADGHAKVIRAPDASKKLTNRSASNSEHTRSQAVLPLSKRMAIRREPRSPGSHIIPQGDYRARISQSGGPDEPVSIGYFRLLPSERKRIVWRPTPEDTFLVLTEEGTGATNLQTGKELARLTLQRLSSGELIGNESPYAPPIRPEIVQEIEHPTLMLKAIILRWPAGFEVRTIGFVPNGFALPVATPSISQDLTHEWGRLDIFERILTDTIEEAMEAASAELDSLSMRGLPIKPISD